MSGDFEECKTPNSYLKTIGVGDAKQLATGSPTDSRGTRQNRRKRLQLSCGECRKKKLSCDRNLPCQRCSRSGRSEQCSFETGAQQVALNCRLEQEQAQRNDDEIRNLRAEVSRLKGLISLAQLEPESHTNYASDNADLSDAILQVRTYEALEEAQLPPNTTITEISDPRQKSPRGYYSQHTLLQFFIEIPQLFPFIKETSDEWLKPIGVHLQKEKPEKNYWKTSSSFVNDRLESLILSKDETDILVFFYLDHFEQIHRVVHVPTFKREYVNFWTPGRVRYPAMAALILSMMSISAAVFVASKSLKSLLQAHANMPVQWIHGCDEWVRQQSSKRCKLVHHQISCLVYLAKRMNTVRKKRFWKESGILVQNAITDGLNHCQPPLGDSPYTKEMKRRVWAVICELDLQNTFEYGLPSLLHSIGHNINPPENIEDNDFDEATSEFPTSKPLDQYTPTSYLCHSAITWEKRLEISQRLYSPGRANPLSYEEVLRYSHELTQLIDALPPWNVDEVKEEDKDTEKSRILTYAILRFQLVDCIFSIHRPYFRADGTKYWLSENICYQMSRDTVLLNIKLSRLGVQSLTLFREDLLIAFLNITHLSIIQPKNSSSIISTDIESSINLLEQCLPLIEERYLRCFYGEPWCFMTVYTAMMLLKVYLGKESWRDAKNICAQGFIDLYYKHVGRKQTSLLIQRLPQTQNSKSESNKIIPAQPLEMPNTLESPTSDWLDSNHRDIGADHLLDLDMDLDDIWDAWVSPWPTSVERS